MRELFLGIDIGTSSSKGLLAEADGTVVATAAREHELSVPYTGWAEHDPERIWWEEFTGIARELTAAAPGPVAAVAVSGIGPCVLPCDGDVRPLRPAILYGIDTRATAEIAELTDRYGADRILRSCGSPLTSQAVGPKLLWLRRHEPEVWAATRRLLMASSLLVYRLTGEYVLDHHSASQCTPLYDLGGRAWIEEWADDIAPGLELPKLASPGEVVGAVTDLAAEATGIPAGTPVLAGTVDAWAEATSAGVRDPGDVMVMYGTTMFLIEVLAEPLRSPYLWGTAGVFTGTYSLAAGMATSGAITDWLRRLTSASYEDLVAAADAAGRGADGLLMLPYFAGERTPLFDPDARGVVAGLTLRHGSGHLYRAALEATAFGVRHNLETMRAAGGAQRRLVAVGGGTRGGLWTQIVSDVLDRPQGLPERTIGACDGDALLAAMSAGAADPATWNPVGATVVPDPEARADYGERYELYRALYADTRDIAHTLARTQTP